MNSIRETLGEELHELRLFPIVLPPLRERAEDVELLADHFLDIVNAREATQKRWSPEARVRLRAYAWPGNVRELKNAVERAAILADVTIGPELIPGREEGRPAGPGTEGSHLRVRVGSQLDEVERRLILATLEELGDKKRTAEALGISLKTLYNRLAVYQAGHPVSREESADVE